MLAESVLGVKVFSGFGIPLERKIFYEIRSVVSIKAASQHFRLCIVEMHSRKLRHDDTSAKNVTQYVGYALASQRVK